MPDLAPPRLTERLRLVLLGPDQAEDLYRLHQDPGIARWYGGEWTREQARDKARAVGQGWAADGIQKWIAYDAASGDLIGRGGLSYAEVDGARRLEIGWAVVERLWGRGYACEIGRAGLAVAFDQLGADEVVALTEPHNIRSRAVMERLGFTFARDIRHRGEPFVLYTLLREPGSEPPSVSL